MAIEIEDGDRVLRLPEILALTGLSRASIYNLVGAGTFPVPLKLGPQAVGWLQSEVRGWLATRERSVAGPREQPLKGPRARAEQRLSGA